MTQPTITQGILVEAVDFAVPTHYTAGDRFGTWQEAVDHARSTIKRFEYPGQRVNENDMYYHPRSDFQEGGTLVSYSRAFVDMRIKEPVQDRGDGVASGTDRVAMRWEVFHDGSVEASPDRG